MALWFQHRLEPMAIDRSSYCHLPARRQLPARSLRQTQNSPSVDRGQRGVKTNCWDPCALTHRSHIFLQSWRASGSLEYSVSTYAAPANPGLLAHDDPLEGGASVRATKAPRPFINTRRPVHLLHTHFARP